MIEPEVNEVAFGYKFKCKETFKKFIINSEYEVYGFGKDRRGDEKVDVWYIRCISNEQENFSIVKPSINKLFKHNVLEIINDEHE